MKINFLILMTFAFMILSCTDDGKSEASKTTPVERRSDRDCGYCEEIFVEITYSPIENDCCKAQVLIKSTTGTKDCKQMIFINGEFLQFVDQDLITLSYPVCPANPIVVRVMGFDDTTGDFTKKCFEERLACGGCCENVSYDAFSCGKVGDTGCCAYTLTFFNQSTCLMNVYNAEGKPIITLPAYSIINNSFTACPNDPASLKYFIGKSETEPCKEVALSTNCAEACNCGSSTILVKQLKNTFIKGCCRFSLTAVNKSNCTLYLMNEGGDVLGTIAPGQTFKTTVEECASKRYYLSSSGNINGCGTCASAIVKCGK